MEKLPGYDQDLLIELFMQAGMKKPITVLSCAREFQEERRRFARTDEGRVVPAQEFALFPDLPKEMRLKIWKHTLPGPRIIQLVPGPHSQTNANLTELICRASNAGMRCNINAACPEARGVFTAAYKKLVIGRQDRSDKDPYFYIDYDIDTAFVESTLLNTYLFTSLEHPGIPKTYAFLKFFADVKHLAVTSSAAEWTRVVRDVESKAEQWKKLTRRCKKLLTLTQVNSTSLQPVLYQNVECVLLKIDDDFDQEICKDLEPDNIDMRIGSYILGAKKLGDLNMLVVAAGVVKERFEALRLELLGEVKQIQQLGSMEHVELRTAIIGYRSQNSPYIRLEYDVARETITFGGITDHLHSEFVELGNGQSLASCSAIPRESPNKAVCGVCRRSRWAWDWHGIPMGPPVRRLPRF